MKQQKGVTMIEIMIVVAVIGVLVSIAYPSYQDHVLRGHRSQAMADLIKIQLTLEENYTQTGSYDFSIITENNCSFCESDISRYKISYDDKGSNMDKYKIIATPQTTTGQNKDNCGTLYLNAAGIGTAKNGNNDIEGCW